MESSRIHPLEPLAGTPVVAFVKGALLPLRAVRFLVARPRLWGYVAIPLAVNMVLFVVALYFGGTWFAERLRGWISSWGEASWIVRGALVGIHVLFWAVILVAVYFVFTPVALIIAAPFNDPLAEKVERACGFAVRDERPFWKAVAQDAWFSIYSELKRLGAFLAVFAVLLPLHLIPVAGSVASFAWVVFAAALEFSGYAADRRRYGLRRKCGLVWGRRPAAAGFGLASVLLLMIPFVNVLMVPVCVVAGTFFFGMAERPATGPTAAPGP